MKTYRYKHIYEYAEREVSLKEIWSGIFTPLQK